MKNFSYSVLFLALLFIGSLSLAETSQIYSEDIVQEEIYEDDWHFYQLDIDNPSKLTVKLRKISSDVDLYVSRSKKPTEDSFVCAPQKSGKLIETCRLTSHTPGKWYIGIHGKTDSEYQLKVKADEMALVSQISIR